MALSFDIGITGNCGKFVFNNCTQFCVPDHLLRVDYLVPCIKPPRSLGGGVTVFNPDVKTNETILTYEWVMDGGAPQTAPQAVFTLNPDSTHILELTVTTTNFTGSATMIIQTGASANIIYVASPCLDIAVTKQNFQSFVHFDEHDYVSGTTTTPNGFTVDGEFSPPPNPLPYTFQTSGVGITDFANEVIEDDSGIHLSVSGQFQNIFDFMSNCNDDVTEDFEEAILYITPPGGTTYSVNVTDKFTSAPFEIDISDLGITYIDGIYEFRLIVKNAVGNHIIACIRKPLICQINCKFAQLLHSISKLGCCTDCEQEDVKKALTVTVYKVALDNAVACKNEAEVNNLIDFLSRLLITDNCSSCT